MARKKNSAPRAAKQAQNENKPSSKEGQAGPRPADTAQGYEAMSTRAMEMWREQLGSMLTGPQAFQDAGKMFEPYSQLFTQAAQMWLMMMDSASQMARAGGFGGFTSGYGAQDKAGQNTKSGRAAADGATPASALSGASTYAVAQLAARVADLEKRIDAILRASGTSSSSAGPAKPAASRRRGKAKIITLRPAGTGGHRS